jgi:quercetin dioxygenase-like cupin family protein
MLGRNSEIPEQLITSIEDEPLIGTVRVKELLVGESALVLEVRHSKGMKSPDHVHGHDSYCYLVSGRSRTRLGEDEYVLEAGDGVLHPRGVPHSLEALEDCHFIVFKMPPERVT